MDKKNLKCHFDIESNSDDRFQDVKIWVAHEGWNLNDTYFSIEKLEEMAEDSLGKIPIVAYLEYDENDKDFAGHEEAFVIEYKEDGEDEVKLKYLGMPYGVIPPNPDYSIEGKDGKQWLTVKGYIWNKFDGSELFENVKGQSMELLSETLEGVHTDNLAKEHEAKQEGRTGYVITNATFDALCALGDNYTPAMKGSVIENISNNFTQSKFKSDFEEMFKEYANYVEGGETVKNKDKDYELSLKEKFEMISQYLAELEIISMEDYEFPKWILSDVKEDNVYFMDNETWEYYGAPYEITEEDGVMVDIENKFEAMLTFIPKSEAYVKEFEYDNIADIISNHQAELDKNKFEKKLKNKSNEYSEKIDDLKADIKDKNNTIEKLNSELEDSKQFKAKIEKANKVEYIESVDNLDDGEKSDLIDNVDDYTMDTLKDEVAKVIGSKSIKFTSNKVLKNKNVFTPNEDKETKSEFQKELDRILKK